MSDQICVVLNWNVRGLNNPARRKVVKDLVQETRCTVACFQETKMEQINDRIIVEALGEKFKDNYVCRPSEGASGGILLAVHSDYYKIIQTDVRDHSVTTKLESTLAPIQWWISAVYGPQTDTAKLQFLQEMRQIKQSVGDKWMIIGDYNMILQAADKSTSNLNHRIMRAFRDAVNELELKELRLAGRKYTWTNNRTHTRIDRVFCTIEWESMLPNCSLRAESSATSDHCPFVLVGDTASPTYRGFRFEAFWAKLPGYWNKIQEEWSRDTGVYNTFLNLHIKMERTGKALRQWARGLIGTNKILMKAAALLIGMLETVQDFRQLTAGEVQLKQDLKNRMLGLAAMEKLRARQQSRLTWLRANDANSKLFFLSANGRKRKNHIQTLHTATGQLHTHQEKAQEIYEHFSNVFSEPAQREITLDWSKLNLPRHDLQHLEEPFTEEEVQQVIMRMPGEKAPGPDGYIGVFYKTAWSVIKDDLLAAINLFFNQHAHQLNLLNSGHIVLIPKCRGTKNWGLQANKPYT